MLLITSNSQRLEISKYTTKKVQGIIGEPMPFPSDKLIIK